LLTITSQLPASTSTVLVHNFLIAFSMSLINPSYFVGQLTIAQRAQPQVSDDIQSYCDRCEQEFLSAALGYDLMVDFLAGIKAPAPIDTKWAELKNGVVFKNTSGWWPAFGSGNLNRRPFYNNNQNMNWYGFAVNKAATPSPLAGYIYYEYMRDLNVQNTGIGFVKTKGEGSVTGNPYLKLVDRWNNMCDSINTLWMLLATRGVSVYPSYNQNNLDYNFFERQNIFGI
jgi:hypothetical protein